MTWVGRFWEAICCSCCVDRYNSCNAGWFVRFLAKLLFIASICMAIVGIIGYSFDLYRHGRSRHLIGWFSAGGFVALTLVISIRQIVMHLLNWRVPGIQKYIVRILWMVPLYSVESWLALRFRRSAIYIETFRECYEAYVIWNFMHYIIALLGEENQLIMILKSKPRDRGVHVFPFNYVFWSDIWIPGAELLTKCKVGVLQYVIIKNITALIVFSLQSVHMYGEGHFQWNKGYGYISVINFASQFIALYCLAYFYNATKENLAPFKPFGKFLCVKMVVFFTWAQSIVISILVSGNIDNSSQDPTIGTGTANWTGEQISKGFQDFTICIEMFLFALAFNWAYPYQDFTSGGTRSPTGSMNAHTPRKFKDESSDAVAMVTMTGNGSKGLSLDQKNQSQQNKHQMQMQMHMHKKHSKNSFDLSTGPRSGSSSPRPIAATNATMNNSITDHDDDDADLERAALLGPRSPAYDNQPEGEGVDIEEGVMSYVNNSHASPLLPHPAADAVINADSHVEEEDLSSASDPYRNLHHDLSGAHAKQPFFAAFLQSSIPQDVWDDIRNVKWKVDHTPLGSSGGSGNSGSGSGSIGSGSGGNSSSSARVGDDNRNGDDKAADAAAEAEAEAVVAVRSLESALVVAADDISTADQGHETTSTTTAAVTTTPGPVSSATSINTVTATAYAASTTSTSSIASKSSENVYVRPPSPFLPALKI